MFPCLPEYLALLIITRTRLVLVQVGLFFFPSKPLFFAFPPDVQTIALRRSPPHVYTPSPFGRFQVPDLSFLTESPPPVFFILYIALPLSLSPLIPLYGDEARAYVNSRLEEMRVPKSLFLKLRSLPTTLPITSLSSRLNLFSSSAFLSLPVIVDIGFPTNRRTLSQGFLFFPLPPFG